MMSPRPTAPCSPNRATPPSRSRGLPESGAQGSDSRKGAADPVQGTPALMTTPADFALLDTLEKVRLLGHEDRLRVLRRLTEGAFTGAMLARDLDMPGTRIHYHLKLLEAGGLIVQDRIGRKLWKEERYFVAAASQFLVDPKLTCSDTATVQRLLRTFELAFVDWRRREILEIDWSEVSRRIVIDALRATRGQRVFVMFGPDTVELAESIIVELEAKGALPLPKLWSRNYILRTLDRHDDEALKTHPYMAAADVESLDAGVFVHSQVAQGDPPSAEQMAKLPRMMKSVSDWQRSLVRRKLPYIEVTPVQRAEVDTSICSVVDATESYWKAVLREHLDLEPRVEHFRSKLDGDSVLRIECPRGTNLSMPFDPAMMRLCDGRISDLDLERGATYENLPGGYMVFLPRRGQANGVLHFESTFIARHHFRDVVIRIEAGRMVEVDAANDVELFKRYCELAVGDAELLSYLCVGCNQEEAVLTGKPLLDACFTGVVCAGFGRNELYGGDVCSTSGIDVCARGTTVTIGEQRLLDAGELLLPPT